MNDWVVPALTWDDSYVPDRGKVLSAEELEAAEHFYRYLDVDGDGIPYRSLPGVHPAGAYFTRGSGHDKHGRYTEDSEPYTEVVDRLLRKVEGAAPHLPEPEVRLADPGGATAPVGLVTVGVCRAAVLEAMDVLAERGIAADYLRVRAFPFHPDVEAFMNDHEVNYVIEQNRDGQLKNLLLLETGVTKDRLRSVRYYGGLPLSAHHVLSGLGETIPGLDDWAGAEGATS